MEEGGRAGGCGGRAGGCGGSGVLVEMSITSWDQTIADNYYTIYSGSFKGTKQ